MNTRIEISYKTILFIFAILALFWFLNAIKEILISLFIAFVLMSALRPIVDKLEGIRIPRIIAIILIYLLIILFFITIGSALFPVVIRESGRLIKLLPVYFEEALQTLNLNVGSFSSQIGTASGGVLKLTIGIFSNIFSTLSLFVFTFYLLWERNHLKTGLINFLGEETGERIFNLVLKIEKRLGEWVRGQFFLCFIIGLATFIGLTLFGFEYALPLAILAGILEIVPTIGPIMSSIPAIIIALSVSPFLALATAALYFVIQQSENHLLVPNVMKKVTGLSPIIIIIALMIGGKLMGVLGVILSVPIVLVIQVLIQEYLVMKK